MSIKISKVSAATVLDLALRSMNTYHDETANKISRKAGDLFSSRMFQLLAEYTTAEVKSKEVVTQYFTFGFGHGYDNGYVVITGDSIAHCREIMFRVYGKKWFTNYSTPEAAGVDKFDLWLVNTINEVGQSN